MTDKNNILEVKNLYMLFGNEKQKAIAMKKDGVDKNTIYKKTRTTIALWDINLEIEKGEIFVIIGLSGSGKSTLLRCFNLLNKPTQGKILYGEKVINDFNKEELLNYRRDKISMVFQNFGLMSHRNVLTNVEYGLEIKGKNKEERKQKALEMINMVGLEGYEQEPITSLSGGMKQRVGLARALANDPEILLMDEPFSALDPLVKRDMQFELLSIQRKLNKTIVFITHDINEAFKLGDKVAIMKDGEIIQIATPEDMISNPKNEYVENFIHNADKSQVLSVKNVMSKPNSIVKITDNPVFAITMMKNNKVSTAYVVDHKMRLQGLINIQDTVKAYRNKKSLKEILIQNLATTTIDTQLADIIDLAANTKYPIAVLDEDKMFQGIVTKADVLSNLK